MRGNKQAHYVNTKKGRGVTPMSTVAVGQGVLFHFSLSGAAFAQEQEICFDTLIWHSSALEHTRGKPRGGFAF